MQPIVIHHENADKIEELKSATFPPHVVTGIEESIKQHENGQTISLQEFKEKHLAKKEL